MKSDSASAVELGKLVFLTSVILAGVIFIFIGLHAASNPPATESATGRARLDPNSDAAAKIGRPAKPIMPIYSSDASDTRMLPQAARFEGKNDASASSLKTRSADTPGPILILLIIGVFGYIWVNADQLVKANESDKIRINLIPKPMNPQADGLFFTHRGDQP
jgi:hypothetical protein